jgi:hypothetical protein
LIPSGLGLELEQVANFPIHFQTHQRTFRVNMRLSFLSILPFMMVLDTVSACEGDCIMGITNAFLGNYTIPIQKVFENTVRPRLC